jgi:enoyl-CoA hydratase/carnithine racemase
MPEVHLTIDDGVAVLTLDDPDRHNAWSPELEAVFYERLEEVDDDPAARVAVMTGEGRMFCPGASTERLGHIAEVGLDYSNRIPFTRTLEFGKPLIAAINGGCAGIGFIQAMFCDLRFMSSQAKLTTAFVRRGLPAEHAISWLLPRVVGYERALDLLLSGRTVTADEALRIGLVSRVFATPAELLDGALEVAGQIAANGPVAVRLTVAGLRDGAHPSAEAALAYEALAQPVTFATSDLTEGIAASKERRRPTFTGR